MGGISQYLLSVIGAAMICAVVQRLLSGKGSASAMGKLLVGIVMALTVIRPLAQVQLADFGRFLPEISLDAQVAVSEGEASAQKALAESISSKIEAYILDKAAQMNVTLAVEVELTQETIPHPCRVRLQGKVSPYAKSRLQNIIQEDLGINKENQLWT